LLRLFRFLGDPRDESASGFPGYDGKAKRVFPLTGTSMDADCIATHPGRNRHGRCIIAVIAETGSVWRRCGVSLTALRTLDDYRSAVKSKTG
jgi:hypothetical protein